VLDFQQGVSAAINAGDGLRAALHTPAWVREHLEEARLLLLIIETISCMANGRKSFANASGL
jgi:hypothetical protein